VDALIAALQDDDWRVRMKAGTALGAYADPKSIEPLIDTLVDPDRKVRLWAWKALRRLGEPAWTRMYERFGPESVGKELAFVDESGIRRNLQEIIRANLIILGKQGLFVAGQMLAHPLSEVRRLAAQILGEIGPDAKEAAADLMRATEHSDIETRLAAIRALAKIGEADSNILPTLEALAQNEDKKVADEAKKALTEIKNAKKQKDDEKKDKAKRPGKSK
jgi:HEAT repeat protein